MSKRLVCCVDVRIWQQMSSLAVQSKDNDPHEKLRTYDSSVLFGIPVVMSILSPTNHLHRRCTRWMLEYGEGFLRPDSVDLDVGLP